MSRDIRHRTAALVAAIACIVLAPAAFAVSALPTPLELSYSMSYRGLPVGKLTRTLKLHDGVYRFESHAEPTGLTALLTSDNADEAGEFEITGGIVKPRVYHVTQTGAKAFDRKVTFDWKAGVLRFNDGRDEPLPAGCLDNASLMYQLMLNGAPAGEREISLTDGRKVNRYAYRTDGKETIDTALGRLDTVRVTRVHPKRDETLTVWLATGRHNLPVRIEKRKAGKSESLLEISAARGL